MFVLIKVFWRSEMARILEISHLSPGLKKKKRKNISCYIGWWWWCSLILVVCLRKYFILLCICMYVCIWYVFFLVLNWVNYISLSILRCDASVLLLTLFHMPNLLSFPFIVLLCLFFLLVTFVWLIILNNELPCTFE